MAGAVVMAAHGKRRVASVDVHAYAKGQSGGRVATLPCDLLAMSGGLSPVLHLHAQSGGKPQWLERKACFVPGKSVQAEASVGRRPASSTCVSRWRRQPALAPKPPAPPASPSRRRCPFPGGVHRRGRADAAVAGGRSGRVRARPKQFVDSRTTWRRPTSCWPRAKASNPSSMSSAIRRWASARIRASSATSTAWPSWRRPWASPSPRLAPPPTGRTHAGLVRRLRRTRAGRVPRSGAQDLPARMARRARRAVRGRGQLEAALVLPAAGRGPARRRAPRVPGGAQRRRHPGCPPRWARSISRDRTRWPC